MKFIQRIAPTVNQFKCKDCGCLTNLSIEVEEEYQNMAGSINKTLLGGRYR